MYVFSKPPEKPKDEDIFIDDVNALVEIVFPSHEGQHELFKKFGYRTGGICDVWRYNEDWKDLPEVDKWKYVALCSLYWEKQYKYWYNEKEYKEYKESLKEWSKHNPQFLDTLKHLESLEEELQYK